MKIGNLLVNAAYLGSKVLTAIAVGATKVWEGVSKYIKFKDPVVEQLCMKWSSDGIGLTPEDAAKVTDIGTTFQGNTEITSFDELDKFTGVTSFSANCFNGCESLEFGNIYLPNIESIQMSAFKKVKSIDDIILPNLISMSNRAFHSSGIKKVSNLGFITRLGGGQWNEDGAFRNCKNLTSVVLPDTLEAIGSANGFSNCFADCSSLTNININHVKEIGIGSFKGCTSLSINLDNPYLTRFEQHVFLNSGDITLNTPNVNHVSEGAFLNSRLTGTINLPLVEVASARAFQGTLIEEVYLGKVKRLEGNSSWVDHGSFYNCKNLRVVVLSDCVEYIENGTFYNCEQLKYIKLPTVTPPVVATSTLPTHKTYLIYVPDESVQAYKSATNWSAYADRIKPLSEYVEPTNE